MATPPLLSTVSAVTEIFVTAAVFWFFGQALFQARYRWIPIALAVAYETAFNISYMVARIFTHQEGSTHVHDAWVTWFVALHGTLSLAMFLGLVAFVAWAWVRVRRGDAHPLGRHRGLSWTFLAFWTVSVLTGEAIYAFYWLGLIA